MLVWSNLLCAGVNSFQTTFFWIDTYWIAVTRPVVGNDALPSLRKHGYNTVLGVPSAAEVAQALGAILRDELPVAIEPIVARVVWIRLDRGNVRVGLALVGAMAGAVGRLAATAGAGRRHTAGIRFWAVKDPFLAR
jgi:hypothetical protein